MRDISAKSACFSVSGISALEETVHKDIAFGPLNLGLSQDETDERVAEAVGLVGLNYESMRTVRRLTFRRTEKESGYCRVIAMKPDILILDEPTAGLDPKAHADILRMIEKIHEVQQNTIILVSHNMGDIARLADKILVMDRGKLAITGNPTEVFGQADLLESLGLGLPPSTHLMRELLSRGVPVSTDVLTIDAAEAELYRILA